MTSYERKMWLLLRRWRPLAELAWVAAVWLLPPVEAVAGAVVGDWQQGDIANRRRMPCTADIDADVAAVPFAVVLHRLTFVGWKIE